MSTTTGRVLGLMAGVFAATAFVAAPAAHAVGVYDSGGFDSTTRFSPGNLAGQDGGVWQQFGDGSATVQTAVALSAARAVLLTHGSGDGFFLPQTSPFTPAGPTAVVTVDVDARLPTGATGNPVYGLEVFDTEGNSVAMAGLDATSGKLYTRNPDLSLLDLGANFTASKDQWYHVQLRVDYPAQQYTILVDGVARGPSRSFVTAGGAGDFSDADLVATSVGGGATTGGAYVDNFVVQAVAVPEPASVGAVAVAAAGLLFRRRRGGRPAVA